MAGTRSRRMDRPLWVRVAMWVAPLVVVGLLVVGALLTFGSLGPTPLQKAADACSVGENVVQASDTGTSLKVASGKQRTGWQATVMSVCVLTELGAPESVKAKIEVAPDATTPQNATWDDYVVTWTYDPDAGLEIAVQMGKAAVDDFQRA